MATNVPSLALRLIDVGLKNLAQIRAFVQEAALTLDVVPDDLPMVLLAVDEAVTNVILHGYGGRGGPLQIEIERQRGALVIRLRDEATTFDPTGVPAPDLTSSLDARTPGALGVYFIRQIMDQLIYRPLADHGNELTMIKQVHSTGA